MRILYVTSGLPWPLTSGKLRHYFLIRELAARHDVTLLALAGPDARPEHVAPLETLATVRTVAVDERTRSGSPLRRTALALGGGRGPGSSLSAEVRAVGDGFDAVCLTGRRSFPALRALRDHPLVVDLCDATSLNLRGRLRVAPVQERPRLVARYAMARWMERTLVAGADATVFASYRDRHAILGTAASDEDGRAAIVPNGVDTGYWQRTSERLGRDIVFTGVMDYAPNTDAAIQLADVILPLVRRSIPDARLCLVGRDPPAALRARAGPNVVVTGFVDDVRPYLDAAAVFAAPLRFGAGVQNKVLEAMSMAVPSVISPIAAAGLRTEAGSGPPVDVANDPDEVARRLVDRLTAAGSAPDETARAWVSEHFSWRAAGNRLESVLADVASTSGGGQ